MNELPKTNKSLGQHWLTDESALAAMCDAADVGKNDTVLEIGPGVGTLTSHLVRRAREVIAVEFDGVLAMELPFRVPDENLEVIQADILRYDLSALTPGYKIVANIPYYLTSNLLRVISESSNPPSHVALLVQKEVAERVTAKPGDLSVLGVSVQFYWEVSLGRLVPAELFTPPPKVDSQILILTRRSAPLFPDVDPKHFFRLVKAGFSNRRKTLHNSLAAGYHIDKNKAKSILESADIDPGSRAQELSLEQWYALAKTII